MPLKLRDKYTFDQLSLGEIMLRLDPCEGRIRTAREFTAWEGGGEYNVSRGLRKCFGLKTAVCTVFVDNEVGHLIDDFIMQGGVATDFILWKADDGIGRSVRNGLNFTERGFGIRGAVGVPDRGHTAASQLKPGDFNWDKIFGELGVRWFHTGGIFAALSETTAALTVEAVKAAAKYGTIELRLELPAELVEEHRRSGESPGSQSRDCPVRRCDDWQRRGFYGELG